MTQYRTLYAANANFDGWAGLLNCSAGNLHQGAHALRVDLLEGGAEEDVLVDVALNEGITVVPRKSEHKRGQVIRAEGDK